MSLDVLPHRFPARVLYTLLVCTMIGVQAFPVVYPSFTGTRGFAYNIDTGEVLTVPAALEYLLCSTPEESVEFRQANRPCSEIVFFTSSSSLTFQFLNVSSNGVIQPITRTPQAVSSNNGVNFNWIIPTTNDDTNEETTSGVNAMPREPTSSQTTSSTDAVPSALNDTRSGNPVPDSPSRSTSPSLEDLSSPPPVNETAEVAGNEIEASVDPTPSVPISSSTANETAVPEEEPTTEDASTSPSPSRATANGTEVIIPEPSQSEVAPIPPSAESVIIPEPSQSEVAPIPPSAESVIIPEPSSVASIPAPSTPSPSSSFASAPALHSESESIESGTTPIQFAAASVPETSNDDAIIPYLESFSELGPSTDRTIVNEVFAQGSEPSMDESEESEQHDTEASSPSENAPDHRSTSDTDLEFFFDEDESSNTPTRRSRRSRRGGRPVSSNATDLEGDPDLLSSGTADASLESETEGEEAEEAEGRSLRRLMQDLPSATDAAVLQANETAGFLDPTGALRNDVNFVLQLEASSFPERTLVTLEFTFGDGISRSVMVYFDSARVSAVIEEQLNPNEDPSRRREEYVYRVRFSSRMISLPNEELVSCPSVTDPLNALTSAQFDPTPNSLTPNDLTAVIRASDGLSSCNETLEELDPASIVSVDGVDEVVEVDEQQINVDELRRGGRLAGSVVTVNFSIAKDRKKRISFEVGGDAGVSLSGVPINQQAIQFRVGLNSGKIRDAQDVGEILGTTVTIGMGAAIGFSFFVSIGMPFLSFFNLGSFDPVGQSSSLSSVVELMQLGQRTYLMTKLAAPNLPENFIAYAQQLHWTMLDFDLPWKEDPEDDDDSETVRLSGRKLLNSNNTQEDEDESTKDESINDERSESGSGKDGEDDSVYRDFEKVYFWAAVSLVGMVFLHLLLLVVFLANEKKAMIATLAGGPANLFGGTTTQIIVGTVFLVVCVLPLLYWHVHILRKYVLMEDREERNIVYVLTNVNPPPQSESNPDTSSKDPKSRRGLTREERQEEQKEKNQNETWFDRYFWGVLFGRPYRSGEWTWKDDKAKRVVSRFGPIFEDYRGEPMYEIPRDSVPVEGPSERPRDIVPVEGPSESKAETKQFAPVEAQYRYSVDLPRRSFYLRVSDKLIGLAKTVFVAAFIMGEDYAEEKYQAIVILIIFCAYLAHLRVHRPHSIRWRLALAMVTASTEIILYVFVVVMLYTSKSQETVFRITVGTVMNILLTLCKVLTILDVVMSSLEWIKEALGKIYDTGEGENTPDVSRDSDEHAFEEIFWKDPRKAVNSKIVEPLVASMQSLRARRSGRRGNLEASTEQNPSTAS